MKKRILIVVMFVIVLLSVFLFIHIKEKKEQEKIYNEIVDSYSKYVETINETNLYDSNNNIIGKINKGVKIEINKKEITNYKDCYYELSEFPNHYIYYKDFKKIDSLNAYNDYYKNYLVFNENVMTKGSTSFYDDEFNYLYTINKEYNLPIYIKEDDYYGVEYNDHLVYIKKTDNIEIVKSNNTNLENAKDIPVLLYHFFHTHNRFENLKTVISTRIDKFESQMKYLSDNNYMTLKMKDLEYYVSGKVQIKEQSVVLTIDDGNSTIYELAYPVIEKYGVNVTVFAITSWDLDVLKKQTEYVEIHSHTHNMHQTGKCSGGQGGLFKCINYEEGLKDLEESRKVLNGSTYLAYPFGEYTDSSLKILKDAGFTMALTTNYGNAKVGDNLYLIPRMYFYNEYDINTFKRVLE